MSAAPLRLVENNRILSSADPVIAIEVAPELRYRGTLDFDLYGIAHATLFVFAQADSGYVQRQFVVQFEAFLPSASEPDHAYFYSAPELVTLAGEDYFCDTRCIPAAAMTADLDSESDFGRLVQFIRDQGFEPPFGDSFVLTRRLARIVGHDRRAELILVYGEPLAGDPVATTGLDQGYLVTDRTDPRLTAFEARARASFQVVG